MLTKTRITATFLCAALFGAGATTVMAQANPEAGAAPQQGAPQMEQSTKVSDSDLALYAEAAQKVVQMQQSVQAEMQEASSAEEAQKIQAESHQKLINAVRSFGLTVDDYNRISGLIQTDPEVRKRVESLMQ